MHTVPIEKYKMKKKLYDDAGVGIPGVKIFFLWTTMFL